jgi:uncharacterized membrane protein YhaH (DUF805 family)
LTLIVIENPYIVIPENNEETFGVRDAEQIQQMDEVTIGPFSDVNTYCPKEVKVKSNKVGFIKAIALFFINYANFSGRASRSEYWWVVLFEVLAIIPLLPSSLYSYSLYYFSHIISYREVMYILALLIPNISLVVRRLHDIGKSGLWCLMGLIPIGGPIFLLIQFLKGSDGNNRWSE